MRPLTSVLAMTVTAFVDLNADVGEGCGQDAPLMSLICSANIACGYHAGDEVSMRATVAMAVRHGVAVGGHPSFPDREHFGRREMNLSTAKVRECVIAQIDALAHTAAEQGAVMRHVKPHGALYNMAALDDDLADAIARAVCDVDRKLLLFGLAGSALIRAGDRAGLRTVSEVFADRAYTGEGTLVPRNEPGAVLHDAAVVGARAVQMVRDRYVIATDGSRIPVRAETICVHGDTPGAVELAVRIRAALAADGISVSAPVPPR